MSDDPERSVTDVTLLLRQAQDGEVSPARLFERVYEQLRSLAAGQMRGERAGHSLQTTALVHEAWMKLEPHHGRFENHDHYAAVAARAMRQVLLDRARSRARQKRGEDPVRTTLSGLSSEAPPLDVLDLNRALEELAAVDPRGAQVVELRYFGGMSAEEVFYFDDLSVLAFV